MLAPQPAAKRKHDYTTEAEEGIAGHRQKCLSKDGTRELVRVRNHLIAWPVPALEEDSAAGASQASDQAEGLPPSTQKAVGHLSLFVTDTESEREGNVQQIEGSGDVEDVEDLEDTGEGGNGGKGDDGGDHSQSCQGALIVERLADQVQWSQDSRECCNICWTAIASIHTPDQSWMVPTPDEYQQYLIPEYVSDNMRRAREEQEVKNILAAKLSVRNVEMPDLRKCKKLERM
ncbi:hypothetical protein KCV07_g9847, partial [Aureobasidium melanogenum]